MAIDQNRIFLIVCLHNQNDYSIIYDCNLVLTDTMEFKRFMDLTRVQIYNNHLEIIIYQLTSQVLILENGIANTFFIERAHWIITSATNESRIEEVNFHQPIILGMTKASLNTSFSSDTKLQETTLYWLKLFFGVRDWSLLLQCKDRPHYSYNTNYSQDFTHPINWSVACQVTVLLTPEWWVHMLQWAKTSKP